MRRAPVWITGVGAATPLGCSYEQIAANLLTGACGIRRITSFAVDDHPSQIAGLIPEMPCPPMFETSEYRRLSLPDQAATWCCWQALDDAGLWPQRGALRIGIVLGTAAEWSHLWETDGLAGGSLIREPNQLPTLAQRLRQRLELAGPTVSVSAACASANYAFAMARRWIELGWVDVCLAGGCDMAVTPMTLAGFGNLRALSRRNDDPLHASRPFDVDRDGFVAAEGGCMFVLESAERARRRSAPVYAEVAGCGASSDAHHMVIPSPHPEPAIAAVRQALADAGVAPGEVDYINAHATSTPVGDQAEARVLETVFGADCQRIAVSSTKSMTGHMLTAAAAVEALACIVAMKRAAVPPTINLDQPDPQCRLCHVPNEAQERRVRVTVSNSFGFGGSNTSLILRAA